MSHAENAQPDRAKLGQFPAGTIAHLYFNYAETFPTWGKLKGAATLIVIGIAGAQQANMNKQDITRWTATTINIQHVVTGSAQSGQSVRVRQVGGIRPDGIPAVSEQEPLLTSGTRYLLFLRPVPETPGEFYPLGPMGLFTVDATGHVHSFSATGAALGVDAQGAELQAVLDAVQSAEAT
jgi:hypothetical protein